MNAALTGSFVSAGNTVHNAVKLAVKQINDAGGFVVNGKTYKLEPYYRDDRTDVNTAIANARELVEDVGVKAIWGTEIPRLLDRHDEDHEPRQGDSIHRQQLARAVHNGSGRDQALAGRCTTPSRPNRRNSSAAAAPRKAC